MSRGNITRRGKNSWRLKLEVASDVPGKRKIHYETVKGRRQDAERRLTQLLAQADAGTLIEPSKETVQQYIESWLGRSSEKNEPPSLPAGLSPKTAERYRQLAEQQVYPHLGSIVMQKLRPAKVAEWHDALLKSGGKKGKPLSARTVGHAHRVLHRALERAVEREVLPRNVAGVITPPKVEEDEVEILAPDEIGIVLRSLQGHELFPIAAVDLATGLRRSEILALPWNNIDLDGAALKIDVALEETRAGLRFKPPKTKRGRRKLSIPASAVAVLREHRRTQLELRLALGLGRPAPGALVFCNPDGSPIKPSWLSYTWRNTCASKKLPRVTFHALRHTHASALIAAGLDVVKISRRLGHADPTITLRTYAHLFEKNDTAAATAIELALGTLAQR